MAGGETWDAGGAPMDSSEAKMAELRKKKSALYQAVLERTVQPKAGVGITKEDFEFLPE